MAKKLLVFSLVPPETGTGPRQRRFRVLDPGNYDTLMTIAASEQDANRVEESMLRPRAQAPLWAEFRDAIVIEERAPLPRELRAKVGWWRRTLAWRPRPAESRETGRSNLPTGGIAAAAEGIALVASCAAVIAAQMYGVFGWLFLGSAIYLAGILLLSWGLQYVRIDAAWKDRIAIGLPLVAVALIGFDVRGMIHPAFAWSNALLFFSR